MNDGDEKPVEVPYSDLSVDALRAVVEAFVLREGTDYGDVDYTLEQKITHVQIQLESGEAAILFDPESASVGIVMKRDLDGAGD